MKKKQNMQSFTMGSEQPVIAMNNSSTFTSNEVYRSKKVLVKNATLLVVAIAVVLYFTLFASDMQHSTELELDMMDVSFVDDVLNNTNPYLNATDCNVKHVPWQYRCEFVQKNRYCQGNRYLNLQYCVFKKRLQPLYYILAVCVHIVFSILLHFH